MPCSVLVPISHITSPANPCWRSASNRTSAAQFDRFNERASGLNIGMRSQRLAVLLQELLRQARRLAAKDEVIVAAESGFRVEPGPAGFDEPKAGLRGARFRKACQSGQRCH